MSNTEQLVEAERRVRNSLFDTIISAVNFVRDLSEYNYHREKAIAEEEEKMKPKTAKEEEITLLEGFKVQGEKDPKTGKIKKKKAPKRKAAPKEEKVQ